MLQYQIPPPLTAPVNFRPKMQQRQYGPVYKHCVEDPLFTLETMAQIVDKESRQTIPFIFNYPQLKYYYNRTFRDIILKPRQLGFSTEVMGLFLQDTMFTPNTRSLIVAQSEKVATQLFARVRFMYNSLPEEVKPPIHGPGNRKELYFDSINSIFSIGSAEVRGFGRGDTIQNLHCTEVSLPTWDKEFLDGLLESVPKKGRVVLESTARGEGGVFYDMYQEAKNNPDAEYKSHFFRWFEEKGYAEPVLEDIDDFVASYDYEELELVKRYNLAPEQINWRRIKKARLRAMFVQEYPEWEDDDAFIKTGSPIFDIDLLKARDAQLPEQNPHLITLGGELYVYRSGEPGAQYVVGVDTSEGDIHSDFAAAVVLRYNPLPVEQVALLHGRWSPDILSEKVYKLARGYNWAQIAVERNNHGHAVLLNLGNGIVRKGVVAYPPYSKLYVGPDKKLGWHTGPLSKPQMISELDRAIRSEELVINSKPFIKEARKVVAIKGGGFGVPPNVGNDDIVMANAIALMAIGSGQFDFDFI
jgi:hypothetical protein